MKTYIMILLAACCLLTGCVQSSGNDQAAVQAEWENAMAELRTEMAGYKEEMAGYQAELAEAQQENASLKTELDELKNGPGRLLEQAQAHFKSKDADALKGVLAKLQDKHPGSQELASAEKLSTQLAAAIKQEQQDKKNKAAQEAADKKKRLAAATSKMGKEYDEVKEITWYKDKSSPKYDNANGFYIYFGQSDDKSAPWLRLKIQYMGDDWLFIDSYIIKADGVTYNINPSYDEVTRDNDYGQVWEYLDMSVSENNYEMLTAVANSKKTIVRSQGQDYYKDRTVTAAEKKALQNVLDAYEAVGGKP